jgi:acyl carrier protein
MEDRLTDILSELFSAEPEDITPDTDFYDDLCADSLDMLELSMILEEEFDLTKRDIKAMSHYTTVGQVMDYIQSEYLRHSL